MRRAQRSDPFSAAMTDLMTSLMVIFVLLLVTKLNNQASERAAIADELERRLKAHMLPFDQDRNVGRDRNDKNTLVIVIPDSLISFAPQDFRLRPEGERYLTEHIPAWAGILCAEDIRRNIDTVVVEGHSDRTQWQGSTFEESKEKNLALSQQRSMAVVSSSIRLLQPQGALRDCFLEKLSATGRGEEEPLDPDVIDSPKNRRVVFRIRLRGSIPAEAVEKLRRKIGD